MSKEMYCRDINNPILNVNNAFLRIVYFVRQSRYVMRYDFIMEIRPLPMSFYNERNQISFL